MPKIVTAEMFLEKAFLVHGERYKYDLSSYSGMKNDIRIKCPTHGWFYQKAIRHISQGSGCQKCSGRGVDWIERFRSVHGLTYDYSKVNYKGYKTKVEIICNTHGSFLQTPDNHYRGGQGCPICKNDKIRKRKQLSFSDFVTRANQVHSNKYSYPIQKFENMLTSPIRILCPEHGEFYQTMVNHLAGKTGCVKCGNTQSKEEDHLHRFLSNFTPAEQRNRTIIRPKELDIYLPEHKLAVEYCGMYWHSHKDREDEKKNKLRHAEKYRLCQEKGVRLLTVYESEWLQNPYAIKRLLRNAIGKSRGKLMARKCELRKVGSQEARAFYDKYHPQGGAGNGEHYGLLWNGKIVACMRFTLGNNDRGAGAKNRQWTLSRYATRITVAGGASRLFKAFVKEHQPESVKSFSDNRYFGGGMYEQLGFVLEEDVSPDYQVWSQKLGKLLPKPHYQRRQLQKRLEEHGLDETFDADTDPRTEAEMTYLMGARRIYDCGKKRWVWTP